MYVEVPAWPSYNYNNWENKQMNIKAMLGAVCIAGIAATSISWVTPAAAQPVPGEEMCDFTSPSLPGCESVEFLVGKLRGTVVGYGTDFKCVNGGPGGTFCVTAQAVVIKDRVTGQMVFGCAAEGRPLAANVGVKCQPPGVTPAVGGGPGAAAAYGIIGADKQSMTITYTGITSGASVPPTSFTIYF